MNLLVLMLACVVGLVMGAAIWRMNRSKVASLSAPVLIVAIVALVLPWDVDRVAQNQYEPGSEAQRKETRGAQRKEQSTDRGAGGVGTESRVYASAAGALPPGRSEDEWLRRFGCLPRMSRQESCVLERVLPSDDDSSSET